MILLSILGALGVAGLVIVAIILMGIIAFIASFYRKIPQGSALVRTGAGGTKIGFDSGMVVLPVLHLAEIMDIAVKKVEIERMGKDGLICKDNLRADIKVVFFVRVNKSVEGVERVAQTIGCARASSIDTLVTLFEAKFSEALKTVGKRFDFVDLYDSREAFKQEIINAIGTDLNGYVLDDCAIDYLEQTPIEHLKESNILDVEGIKKITELTAREKIKANLIRREEEKTIKKQDVEAKEAILELERQLAEKEEIQRREIAIIKARESAETLRVQEEERLKAERARITTEEELQVAEENKLRQIIVAQKNKERTEAIETEKVHKDKQLEVTEREKIVALAQIEKEKVVEEERKNIQDVIRERVMVEKAVVEEEEKIKDTKAFAEAERNKSVAITVAEQQAEEALVKQLKEAEAQKLSAEWKAQQRLIDAEAEKNASAKEAEAKKIMAEAIAAEEAALGVSEAQVMEAKAIAVERQGVVEANIITKKAEAEAKAIALKAEAAKKRGLVEANIMQEKGLAEARVIEEKAFAEAKGLEERGVAEAKVLEQAALAEAKGIEEKGSAEAKILEQAALAEAKGIAEKGSAEAKILEEAALAEAKGIEQKAEAMKKLDGVGKEHEEFKLRLEKEKAIELAAIKIQEAIAESQAKAIAEALKSANIDIVGGETMFFENIVEAITRGKTIDRTIDNSQNLTALKHGLLGNTANGGGNVMDKIKGFVKQFNLDTEDIKNLSLTALMVKMIAMSSNSNDKSILGELLNVAKGVGIANKKVDSLF